MKSYVLRPEEKATYQLVQNVAGKGHRTVLVENGEALCESCDAVIAREGDTVNLGHRCWRCNTEVVWFQDTGRMDRLFESTVRSLTETAESAYTHWIAAHADDPVENPNPLLQQFLSHTLDLTVHDSVEVKVICDDTNNPPSVVAIGKIVVNVFFRSVSSPHKYSIVSLP